jgi:aspartate/tyrosine/aromatic aminotransferase
MSTFVCSLVCEDEKQAVAVKSQLQQLARPMYSNPPVHGALIVSIILGDPDLKQLWLKEVKVLISYNPTSLLFYRKSSHHGSH